jgi:hypothetical protein
MSIPDLFDKIKSVREGRSNLGVDKVTIMFLCIIVGVGLASFGLGRLSVDSQSDESSDITITSGSDSPIEDKEALNGGYTADRRYVASKNGKLYYGANCSGASRIKIENQIWFSTKEDAEKSGFTLASSCQ